MKYGAHPTGAAPFFRDEAALRSLRRLVRDRLETLSPGKPLRVWVPRCSGGEDVYSVAICLLEALGSRWREIPLFVLATDSNADALFRAREGRYSARAVRGVPAAKLDRFFVRETDRICVKPFVRDVCRFAIHGLVRTPPFSRLDAIVCRESMSGMSADARRDALRSFHVALGPGGVLIDHSEAAAGAPELFTPFGSDGVYLARNPSKAASLREADLTLADARLLESEERFRVLFSNSEDAILVRDAETDAILQANEAARRLYGWSSAELLGMRGKDLLAPPQAARRPGAERRSEERLRLPQHRRKNGDFFPADTSTALLMIRGRPCNILMVRDAASRLRLAVGRRREEEKEAFVGEVVHELRTPIAVIRGSVEALRKGVLKKRDRKDFLEFIDSHAGRMARLVDRLLDLSSAGSAKRPATPSPVLLSEVVWGIAAAFIPVAKRRRIAIKIDIPADLSVLADPADLPHVFGNLLDNAIKFTPRGGKVHIRGRAEGRHGIVSVRDSGGGIAPEDLSRIFERFFRSERTRSTKGTGLGLAIVQGIVNANNGGVVAENDPAGGAVFHVSLPLHRTKRPAS